MTGYSSDGVKERALENCGRSGRAETGGWFKLGEFSVGYGCCAVVIGLPPLAGLGKTA